MSRGEPLFDFGAERAADAWAPIGDPIMGGVSSGRIEATGDGTAAFTGVVSLEHDGGFASVRARLAARDLGAYTGLELRVRGDGRRYKINLRADSGPEGLLYRAAFETRADEWRTLRLPFREFLPAFRGRVVPDAPPLDLSRLTSLGLMISDRQAGPFRLEIARIGAYAD